MTDTEQRALHEALFPNPDVIAGIAREAMAEDATMPPMPTMSPADGPPMPPELSPPCHQNGDIVKLVTASYGWGKAKKGNFLIIDEIIYNSDGTTSLSGFVEGIKDKFVCAYNDVTDLSKAETLKSKRIMTVMQEKFFRVFKYVIPVHKNSIGEEISRTEDKCYGKENELRLIYSRLEELNRLYISADARADNKDILDGIKHYCGILPEMYKNVIIKHETLNAYTYPIELKLENGMHVKYGAYIVEINIFNKTVRVFGVADSGNKLVDQQFIHPNVAAEGHICMGTYSKRLTKALAKTEIGDVLMRMYDLLTNPSDIGAYRKHGNWCTDIDKRCDRCWHLKNKCVCTSDHKCRHCKVHFDLCECIICPTANEPLEDNEFPDSVCVDCEHMKHETTKDGKVREFCEMNPNIQRTSEGI